VPASRHSVEWPSLPAAGVAGPPVHVRPRPGAAPLLHCDGCGAAAELDGPGWLALFNAFLRLHRHPGGRVAAA